LPLFDNWISGFINGEGSFSIQPHASGIGTPNRGKDTKRNNMKDGFLNIPLRVLII